jgi:hypothetical protein
MTLYVAYIAFPGKWGREHVQEVETVIASLVDTVRLPR